MPKEKRLNKQHDLIIKLKGLPAADKTLLRLVFVDNIPKVTLMWLYKIRYSTLQEKLRKLFKHLQV
jgi:hypothetical protein